MDPNSTEHDNDEKYPQLDENSFALFARICLIAGVALFVVVLGNSPEKPADIKQYWTLWGTLGDFTAGVVGTLFALAGFIYVYLSFKNQREANKMQAMAFNHEKVESRYFELVRLHRDNVSELSFSFETSHLRLEEEAPVIERVKHDVVHRQVFQAIKNQFFQAIEELSIVITEKPLDEIYQKDYLKTLHANLTLKQRGIDLKVLAIADLVYLIVFFGVGREGRVGIESQSKGKYQENLMNELIGMAKLKPKVGSIYYDKWWRISTLSNRREILWAIHTKQHQPEFSAEVLKPLFFVVGRRYQHFNPFYPDNYEKYYGGHQFRLGHYFRHIFQTVRFIHRQPDLSHEQKYDYLKHLRGQFSTDEQIVFFLNSLSQLGREWELESKKKHMSIPLDEQLITTYQLIRNIPTDQIKDNIKLSSFYPDIADEGF